MKESIYAATVRETQRKRDHDAYMEWLFCNWMRNALKLIQTWHERKPPENDSVMRSLELRG